jgi:hypothetical protein
LRLAAPKQPGDFPVESFGFLAGRSPFAGETTGAYGQAAERGVLGIATTADGVGVYGGSIGGMAKGVVGESTGNDGVHGSSKTGIGVFGESSGNDAVQGICSDQFHNGVSGINRQILPGGGAGVFGQAESGKGVHGKSSNNIGVFGESIGNDGVQGNSQDANHSGVAGFNQQGGTGVSGVSVGGQGIFGKGSPAGHFEGDVEVTGDIRLFGTGQDCAEDFDIVNLRDSEPGTVMVINKNGALEPSCRAYDKRVAGVISGAGDFSPGIILGKQTSEKARMPIALLGKVYCKVDARRSPIQVGDLLTTSDTPGHAMRAEDPLKAFGAVIGKALCSLQEGQGLIPILVALQ